MGPNLITDPYISGSWGRKTNPQSFPSLLWRRTGRWGERGEQLCSHLRYAPFYQHNDSLNQHTRSAGLLLQSLLLHSKATWVTLLVDSGLCICNHPTTPSLPASANMPCPVLFSQPWQCMDAHMKREGMATPIPVSVLPVLERSVT